jgi:hypothetical protein
MARNLMLSEGVQPEGVSDRVRPSSLSLSHIPPGLQPAIAERMAAAPGAISAEPAS